MRAQRSPLTIRGDYQVARPPPTPLVLIANAAVNKCKTAANSRCFVCFLAISESYGDAEDAGCFIAPHVGNIMTFAGC